jgi:hypothetical protein
MKNHGKAAHKTAQQNRETTRQRSSGRSENLSHTCHKNRLHRAEFDAIDILQIRRSNKHISSLLEITKKKKKEEKNESTR